MLKIANINTGYAKKQILFDVSFEVSKGDIVLLVGSNGSGKSTLLKSIYGLCKIWEGSVYFENEEITNSRPDILLKKGILYIPQKNNLFEQLTVKENLEISGMALNDKMLFKRRMENIGDLFPVLVSNYKMHPMKMSGGERQQLVLAMAMLHQPKLLLIDEPFTGLSPQAIETISKQIKLLNQNFDTTIVMVEHRWKEALPIADCFIVLKLGKVIEVSEEISKFTSEYLTQIII